MHHCHELLPLPARCDVRTTSFGINASCAGGHTAAFFYPAAFFREYIALIMRNRPAVIIFFGLVVVRFALMLMDIVPEGVFF